MGQLLKWGKPSSDHKQAMTINNFISIKQKGSQITDPDPHKNKQPKLLS